MVYLILSTTLFIVILLIIEFIQVFLYQQYNFLFTVISIALVCAMAFVNGIIKGKYNISEQTVNYIYLIFVIVIFIGYIFVHKIKK